MGIIRQKYGKNYFENILLRDSANSRRNKNRLNEILKYRRKGRLLEVGCGKGEFLRSAMKYFDVEGVDISKYAINSIKPKFGEKVKVNNIEKESLKQNNYDAIAAFNLLEHLKEPEFTIKKIHNSLKRDGILIGSVPNNFSLIGKFATNIMNLLDKTHCSTHPPYYWYALFKKSNFGEISFFGEIVINKNLNWYVKNKYWKYISFNLVFLCKK